MSMIQPDSGELRLVRCPWAETHPDNLAYHDTEWGMPVHTESGLFERMSLEAFQSGLSWLTILRKRPAFRAAFANFDPDIVATFDDEDRSRLMSDAGIVRNRLKIDATIANAKAVVALRENGGLDDLLWSFKPAVRMAATVPEELPSVTPESVAMAKELKRRGFRFVGPTTCYALMTAVGIDDGHLTGCFRRGCADS